jgi:hypothetical protein
MELRTMSTSPLHNFDLLLCRHTVANIRWNLDECHIHTRIAHLRPPLAKFLIDEQADNPRFAAIPEILLSYDELDDIAEALRFLPIGSERYWLPCREYYGNATLATGEIHKRLAPAEAQRWADASLSFTHHLCDQPVLLADAIEIVRDWTEELRRYLEALCEFQFLPRPEGHFPTPTMPEAATRPNTSPELLNSEASYLERMRAAVAEHPKGRKAHPDELIASAKANRKSARKALRTLEQLGEYDGFERALPARYQG